MKKRILIVLLIILFIASIIVGGIFIFISNKSNKTDYDNITNSDVNAQEVKKEKNKTGYRNIALLGIDSRYDDYETAYRTDCVLIASINQETDEVTLFSIYRDTYVEMELGGKTLLNKINQAYYNGVENTLKTINKNLDLDITEYAMTNFSSFSDVIDAIGGIELEVDSEELKYINSYIVDVGNVAQKKDEAIKLTAPGTYNLNGVQAMAYCRIRYTEGGDYKRTERMREAFTKAINKIKKLSHKELIDLINKLLPEIRTNIPVNDLPDFINLKIKDSFGWPYTTDGVWMVPDGGKEKDFFGPPKTLESNVLRLHQEVFNQKDYVVPESIKEISKKIIDKTGVK